MGKVGYDPFEGFDRVGRVAQHIDEEAAKVLTYHAALEAELDVILSLLLPNFSAIRTIGFANKIKVLDAAWIGDPDSGSTVCLAFRAFNDLRNAIAHHDARQKAGNRRALVEAVQKMDPSITTDSSIEEMAQAICLYLGDGPTKEAIEEFRVLMTAVSAELQRAIEPIAEAMKDVSVRMSGFRLPLAGLTPDR